MANYQLSVLFALGFVTLINGECVVGFQNGTVSNTGSTCSSFSSSTLNNITICSGIQLSDVSQGNLNNLKAFADSAFDLYTLLRSRLNVSLVVSSINTARVNGSIVGTLSDVGFARLWFQVKLSPYLSSLSRETLSCLSQSNLTCQSFHALVHDLSLQIGPERQMMVYQNFIKPFLARNTSDAGCVKSANSTRDWFIQNFQTFSASASLGDFTALKTDFNGLDVLDKLSPEQNAERIFQLTSNNSQNFDVISKTFHSFLPPLTNITLNITSATSVGLIKNLTDFQVYLRPLGRFIKSSVTIANNITNSSLKNTMISLVLNWSLGFDSNQTSITTFNITNVIEWFQIVVIPVMKTYLLPNQTLPTNVTSIFDAVFAPEPQPADPVNICKVTSNSGSCLISQTGESLAKAINCVAQSNLNFTGENLRLLTTELTKPLQTQVEQSATNSSQSNLTALFAELPAESFTSGNLVDVEFMRFWFQIKMRPLLPNISKEFLSCLATRNFSCQVYNALTEAFVNSTLRDGQDVCDPLKPTERQDLVYKEFMKAFLSRNDTDDPRCLRNSNNSTQWINRNFGPFVQSALLTELVELNRNFTAVEVLPLLSLKQLVEFSVTPGALKDPSSVTNVTQFVKDCQLSTFFDLLSQKVKDARLTQDVNAALIKQIFDRANLSNINVTNQEVLVWFQNRLKPLLANLSESLVTPFFTILSARDCNITQSALMLLNSESSILNNTKNAIYNSILQSFGGSQPLRCYKNNSFISFLNESLFGFGPLPNLTTFLSLIPPTRKSDIINSVSSSELGTYLRNLDVVNNDSQICVIFNNFNRTIEFLDTVDVPDKLKSAILPCVWPLALTSNNQTEIDVWFDRRLSLYLKFLNKDILGSKDTLSASCLSYRKMVNVLGNSFNFIGSQISRADVYTTIKTYLKADSAPKCYNLSDATLNSTAWFVNHIGVFITFLSLDDLYSFGSESTIKTFTVNPENIKLFNQTTLPKNVLNRYTELVFLQNSSFSLFDLPSVLQCDAPVSTYTALNENQTIIILANFKSSCSNVDPAISTALAGNIKTIDASAFNTLGNAVVGLTTAQLISVSPSVLIGGLSTLSNVSGWSFGQAQAIIKVLISGSFQFTNSSSLLNIGSLIGGIPSRFLTFIQPQEILKTSQNKEFVKNILGAPDIVQKTFVTQLIQLGSTPANLLANIPDDMAVQIPRTFVNIPSDLNVTLVKQFNNKKWKPEQAVLFFDTVVNAFEQPDNLSVDILQGFTCSRVQTFSQAKTRGLIKACRRRADRPKVALSETQLTCMNNLVSNESIVDFTSYPPDMLMYYNYDRINNTLCKAYFAEVGAADLSIFSSTLSGRKDILWNNALKCFGITGKSIKKEDLAVLGNLACAANSDFILNSDPEILENLKNCNDLSDGQIQAIETVLMRGTSKYGQTASWNQKTLGDLGILPLYQSQVFWSSFKQNDLSKFLKTFLKFVRVRNTPKPQMKRLFKAIIIPVKAKRSVECIKGFITSVIINDDNFPFGYDAVQFSSCLDATVARDNLASLCEKIDDSDFQRIILNKLNEISPNGLSEDQVQVLKSVSRSATVAEISKWNITTVDTLAALMNPNDGDWTSAQSNQIITKYLSANNNLTASALDVVRGPNLCSLNTNTLSTILPDSIRLAGALVVSQCSSDNKKALFTIANKAFPIPPVNQTILSAFQFIESYLGGADLSYIKNLTTYNISMSLATFRNLDANVISSLSVSDVRGLLGNNLLDLKTYENDPLVRSWISQQLQSDLDKLGIGLTGGKADPTTATTVKPTVAATAGAPGIGRSGWSVSLSILVLIFTIIKVEIIY